MENARPGPPKANVRAATTGPTDRDTVNVMDTMRTAAASDSLGPRTAANDCVGAQRNDDADPPTKFRPRMSQGVRRSECKHHDGHHDEALQPDPSQQE
ncbi:MAG: hypothetical protein CM1200mP26_01040 [Acidimicrobiales bacterium]|nr:MAG: hypothetical protein CM1200mP26_01040 [Acidimicrobiales bacterium]